MEDAGGRILGTGLTNVLKSSLLAASSAIPISFYFDPSTFSDVESPEEFLDIPVNVVESTRLSTVSGIDRESVGEMLPVMNKEEMPAPKENLQEDLTLADIEPEREKLSRIEESNTTDTLQVSREIENIQPPADAVIKVSVEEVVEKVGKLSRVDADVSLVETTFSAIWPTKSCVPGAALTFLRVLLILLLNFSDFLLKITSITARLLKA